MILRFLVAILLFAFASCALTHPTVRLTDEQVGKLHEGMTIEEVRDIIGRPWKLELGLNTDETHRYVMKRKPYKLPRRGFMRPGYHQNPTQYRTLALHYVNRRLVK